MTLTEGKKSNHCKIYAESSHNKSKLFREKDIFRSLFLLREGKSSHSSALRFSVLPKGKLGFKQIDWECCSLGSQHVTM
jgi:hypothetical protein